MSAGNPKAKKVLAWGLAVWLAGPGIAVAEPFIFASQENILFRIDTATNTIEQFDLGASITALTFDSQGRLWATDPDDPDSDGSFAIYRVHDPFGAPFVSLVSDGLSENTASIEWVNSVLYGAQGDAPRVTSRLVTIDPTTGAETPVGITGETGVEQIGGLAFDDLSSTMFALGNVGGKLYTLDWDLSDGPEPTGTFIGDIGFDPITSGLAFWEPTQTLYAMTRNQSTDEIGVYTLNTSTGEATLLYDLSGLTTVRGASGIAVIPAPPVVWLMVIAAGAWCRRR